VVALADTHLRSEPDGSMRRWLPPVAESHLEGADVILHAGDVLDRGVLERFGSYAPVYAVLGNNDRDLVGLLPETRLVQLEGVRIGMVHDSGPTAGRSRRLRRRFPHADVVVFGHSHAPLDGLGEMGQRLLNPGSPTQRRAQPSHSLAEFVIEAGAIVDLRIVTLD
jgi:hypothetical protein